MKNKIQITILSVVVIILGITVFSPKIDRSENFKETNVPEDILKLDDYLKNEESAFDLKKDTEKKIMWYNGIQKTKYSLIYVHGYTASRMEISPFIEKLASKLQSNVFFTRLKGHGGKNIEMTRGVSLKDWIKDVDEAYKIGTQIGEKVIFVSVSTGGTLVSLYLKNHDAYANIEISPNYMPQNQKAKLMLLPFGEFIAYKVQGPTYGEPFSASDSKIKRQLWTDVVDTSFLFPMMASVANAEQLQYEKMNEPLLLFYSEKDKTVRPDYTKKIFKKWGNANNVIKEIYEVKNSTDKDQHVLTGAVHSPGNEDELANESYNFIKKISP